jgi:adenylosuccinate lyase
MIPRYSRKEMSELWSDEERFSVWLEVELLACEAMAEEGLVPKEIIAPLREKADFDTKRVLEIEGEVKHDVIAFLTNVAEIAGEPGRFLHRGMTSSDLLDTSFALLLKRGVDNILEGLEALRGELKEKIVKHKYTVCVGRSHGIHAEPTTFGLKLAGYYAELTRARKRLLEAQEIISVGKIAGAVGTFASVTPSVEKYVLSRLGLQAEPAATQVVARDRHAELFNALALLATAIERLAQEIRHLQRTEVREAEEPFSSGQKGSSAMPHKRNPILSENLTGLARLIRGYAQAANESLCLWHERDISHSSVERVAAPDAFIALDFMLARATAMIKGLNVYPERMKQNLELTRGLVFSGTLLIILVDCGFSREESYKIVQKHALAAWDGGATLKERIFADKEVTAKASLKKLEEAFDISRHIKHVDYILNRVLE